jgi:hypothetical protein
VQILHTLPGETVATGGPETLVSRADNGVGQVCGVVVQDDVQGPFLYVLGPFGLLLDQLPVWFPGAREGPA